jgi:hypothetical protein
MGTGDFGTSPIWCSSRASSRLPVSCYVRRRNAKRNGGSENYALTGFHGVAPVEAFVECESPDGPLRKLTASILLVERSFHWSQSEFKAGALFSVRTSGLREETGQPHSREADV